MTNLKFSVKALCLEQLSQATSSWKWPTNLSILRGFIVLVSPAKQIFLRCIISNISSDSQRCVISLHNINFLCCFQSVALLWWYWNVLMKSSTWNSSFTISTVLMQLSWGPLQGTKLTLVNSQNARDFDNLWVKKISTSKRLQVRIIYVSQTKGKNLLVVSPVC